MTEDIAVLDLSVRAYNCLKRAGIHTVEQLRSMPDDDLLRLRHFGIRCLHEVREKLAAHHHVTTYQRLEAELGVMRRILDTTRAQRVTVSNEDTDFATGHCECSVCGGAIDPWDAYCRHCGAWLEEDA